MKQLAESHFNCREFSTQIVTGRFSPNINANMLKWLMYLRKKRMIFENHREIHEEE